MNKKRQKDLLFEVKDYLKGTRKDEFLIINYKSLDVAENYITYLDTYEANIAKMLLLNTSATLIGYISDMKVFVAGDDYADDYLFVIKSKGVEETFGTFLPMNLE